MIRGVSFCWPPLVDPLVVKEFLEGVPHFLTKGGKKNPLEMMGHMGHFGEKKPDSKR